VSGINPDVDRHDSRALGSAITYLKNCFFPEFHQLERSETLKHMDGRLPHLDDPLRQTVGHIASTVSSLTRLVKSDPRLTTGIECQIPMQLNCLNQAAINVSIMQTVAG
jgi:hypothetical protein